MKKIKIPRKFIYIGCAAVVVVSITVIVFCIINKNSNGNSTSENRHTEQSQPENKEKPSEEQKQNIPDDSNRSNGTSTDTFTDTSSGRSSGSPSQSVSSNPSSSGEDESNLPLCSRKYLSDEEVQYCAEQIRQQMDEENQRKIAEHRAQWCAENMPQIYNNYAGKLNYENQRYEAEVNNYVRSHMSSGGPGGEEAIREIAIKMYSPLHIQNQNNIVTQYTHEVQAYGCDMSGYNL